MSSMKDSLYCKAKALSNGQLVGVWTDGYIEFSCRWATGGCTTELEDAQILMAKVSPGFDASWGIPMLGVQTQKFDNFGL